jgi:membrane associated rhomboid family serine protease
VVIPIYDRNPVRRVPVVTYALIAINFAVFIIGPVSGLTTHYGSGPRLACAQNTYFMEFGAIPKELLSNHQLPPERIGVQQNNQTFICPVVRYHKVPIFSAFTAMFVHGGWLHLLGNMLFLYVFGNNVEDHLGRVRYLLFYLGCGLIATYAFAVFTGSGSTQPLVGASGAIAGVLGAYLWLFPRAKVTSLVPFLLFLPFRLPAWLVLGGWFVLQWAYAQGAGMSGDAGVAYFAHVAGFIAGLLYVVIFVRRPRWPPYSGYPSGQPPGYTGR